MKMGSGSLGSSAWLVAVAMLVASGCVSPRSNPGSPDSAAETDEAGGAAGSDEAGGHGGGAGSDQSGGRGGSGTHPWGSGGSSMRDGGDLTPDAPVDGPGQGPDTGAPTECTPGTDQKCFGKTLRTCGPDGMWPTSGGMTCFICQNDMCTGACRPTDMQCAQGVPQLCDDSGTWRSQPACTNGKTCSGGTCVCTKTDCNGTCVDTTKSCCIAGQVVASGAVNPANTCSGCMPSKNGTDWTARSSCGNGSSGCSCSGGTPVETSCSDGKDNDGDGRTDCADTSCAGKTCNDVSGDAWTPSLDGYYFSVNNVGHSVTSEPTTIVQGSPQAGGETDSRFTFATLPSTSSAVITKAVFRFHYTASNTVGPPDPAIYIYQFSDAATKLCGTSPPLALPLTSTYTTFDCDVTSVVQGWLTSGMPAQNQRTLVISARPYGTITIGATENSDSSLRPKLLIDYHTVCAGSSCGKF